MAAAETVLASFVPNQAYPTGSILIDSQGNLLGTVQGGAYGGYGGGIFELVNQGGGAYALTWVSDFNSTDAQMAYGGLIEYAGNLFGGAWAGGTSGDGAVFELTPSTTGAGYSSTPLLFSFDGDNGANVPSGVIADANGDLFGATAFGGASGDGTVFELVNTGSPQTPAYANAPITLASFTGVNGDGLEPYGGLIMDAAGNLFGVTFGAQPPTNGATGSGDGTVFELVNSGTSQAPAYSDAPVTLATFTGPNGANPESNLIADGNGDLFGTTHGGGAYGDGAVYELVDNGGGYTQKVLISFDVSDGRNPQAGLIVDADGDLFGTTLGGGTYDDGTVYELVNNGGGNYTLRTVFSFSGPDGASPYDGSLTVDAQGDLFGTTVEGGADNGGTVFELTDTGFVVCYCPGTLVMTDKGKTEVERLAIGDRVITSEGRVVPVTWLGVQTVSTRFADPLRVLPIRIKAGALNEGVPSRDLRLSPCHAVLIDEALYQAGALVNGSSIVRETDVPEILTYYHVETSDHCLIMAENTPAETFIDNVDRLNFDNWAEHEALYPEGMEMAELTYPRAKAHRQVPMHVRTMLAMRAAAINGATAQVA